MWEKQTGVEDKQETGGYKPEHLAPKPARQPSSDDGGLLVVQVVLCLVIALLVFLAKTMQMPFVADLQDQYAEMLAQGVEMCIRDSNYAKRQLTWLRRMDGLQWEQAADPSAVQRIAQAWRKGTR